MVVIPLHRPYHIEDCRIFTLSFYLVGVAAALQGQANIALPAPRRRKRATDEELQTLQEILDEVFCDGIPAGSIVPGSCNLQVLDYDVPPACNYLLTFSMVDETALVAALKDVNDDIADNEVIKAAGATATPGEIGGFKAKLF